MIVVTTEHIPGYRVERTIGIVSGASVRSRNFIGDMLGNLKSAFGGRQEGYTRMVNENREDALDALKTNAAKLGANAIIAARFDANNLASAWSGSTRRKVARPLASVPSSLFRTWCTESMFP